MKAKMVGAVVVGLLAGFAAVPLLRTENVQAQRPDKPQAWEYKVIGFEAEGKYGERLNELGGEGWEYVGLLHTSQELRRFATNPPTSFPERILVIFKRPKR
jgi:hypothetical protein